MKLQKINGIGPAKAALIAAPFEFFRRKNSRFPFRPMFCH